jgi:hypothetical protein
MSAPAPIPASGWMASSWGAFGASRDAPIIVNPAASVGAVLAWCHGEVRHLQAVTAALVPLRAAGGQRPQGPTACEVWRFQREREALPLPTRAFTREGASPAWAETQGSAPPRAE